MLEEATATLLIIMSILSSKAIVRFAFFGSEVA
jgi:hypothetical protein